MDSRYKSVVSILLLSFISITVSETGYQVIFSRDDEMVRNTFTLKCQYTSTGLGLSNAKWFFNSTDYSSNPCTQDAMINGGMMDELVLTLVPECEGYIQCGTDSLLSLPKLLLAYPIRILPDTNLTQQTVYLQTGESIVIPCGVRVSATGNFEVEWSKVAGTIIPLMNVTLDSKYGLILENVPVTVSGTAYICLVSAINLNPSMYDTIQGRSTLLDVTTYIQPNISDELKIIRSGNGIKFISSAEANGVDEYRWFKNNIEIRESTNVTIDNIPQGNNVIKGTLEFNSFNELNDGDIIKAVINNTNIHGETMEDSNRAVLFTISPSTCITSTTCITTNEGTSMTMSTTVTVTVESDPISNPFKPDTTSGVTNIILLVIAVVFFLIISFLALIILTHHYKYTNKQHAEESNQHPENDILQIHVGSQTFEIPKNDVSLEDLLEKFNAIILLADLHMDKSDPRVKDAIVQLRSIITEWGKNAKLAKTGEQNVTDKIERDSRSTWFDEMLPALMNLINE